MQVKLIIFKAAERFNFSKECEKFDWNNSLLFSYVACVWIDIEIFELIEATLFRYLIKKKRKIDLEENSWQRIFLLIVSNGLLVHFFEELIEIDPFWLPTRMFRTKNIREKNECFKKCNLNWFSLFMEKLCWKFFLKIWNFYCDEHIFQ